MIEWDDDDAHKNKVANPPPIGQHLQKAVKEINACGISFHVWEKKMPMEKVQEPVTGQVLWEMRKRAF